jgi:peptidoglycan/xylan/chitin deacetylase (PgdA/CDA1 family)
MPLRLRRRRSHPARPIRELIAVTVVLLLTGSAATLVISRGPTSASGAPIAHGDAAASITPGQQDTLIPPPDDVIDAGVAAGAQQAANVPLPALPSIDDPRLRAVPHIPPTPTIAGPHAVNVPILMYHFLRVIKDVQRDRLGYNLSVAPADFALQLALLRREGYTAVSLSDVLDAMETGAPLPARPIVLTFDDGYNNFATIAAPLLAKAGYTGTDFVVSGFVGKPGFMGAAQIRQVVQMGMTIGAHTEHHVDLARVPLSVAEQEIDGSRVALQALCGQPVTDFAYPSGEFTQQTLQLVAAAGFRDAVTTMPGMYHDLGLPYTLTRIRVSGGESIQAFAQSLAGQHS